MTTLEPSQDRGTVVFPLSGAVARGDVPVLCEKLRTRLEPGDASLVVCDVGGLVEPDAVAVDALARLQLTAGRLGCLLCLRHASPELQRLLDFMGLDGVLPLSDGSGRRAETEQREQVLGVEERVESEDPAV